MTIVRGRSVSPRAAVIWLVCMVAFPGVASSQQLRGILSDEASYAPVVSATVHLLNTDGDTLGVRLSGEQGYFVFETGPGTYYVVARALGYRPVRSDAIVLEDGEIRVVEITLRPRPVEVGGVVVSAEREEAEVPGLVGTGFYDRAARGWGEFLYPGELASHPASYTSQLFRELTGIVALRPAEQGSIGPWSDRVMIRSNRSGRTLEQRLCEPRLYVDGVRFELAPGEGLHDAVPRDRIQAVEVHRAPFGAPMRFLGDFDEDRACGVILFWLK